MLVKKLLCFYGVGDGFKYVWVQMTFGLGQQFLDSTFLLTKRFVRKRNFGKTLFLQQAGTCISCEDLSLYKSNKKSEICINYD